MECMDFPGFQQILEIRLPLTVKNLLVWISCVLTATVKNVKAYRLAASGNCKHPCDSFIDILHLYSAIFVLTYA